MLTNITEFTQRDVTATLQDDVVTPQPAPSTLASPVLPSNYLIVGGNVQATTQDANGLVGLTVGIYDNFWSGYEGITTRTDCKIIARCVREFRHPNNARCLTYLTYRIRRPLLAHFALGFAQLPHARGTSCAAFAAWSVVARPIPPLWDTSPFTYSTSSGLHLLDRMTH